MAATRNKPPGHTDATRSRKKMPAVGRLSERMASLYSMVQATGTEHTLERVLDISKRELALAMGVRGVSVKLLDERRSTLRYAAVHGLPDALVEAGEVAVDRSAVSRRVIDGEPFVTGDLTEQEQFQFGGALAAAGIKSVLFVPLKHKHRVIGILGAYCNESDRFAEDDTEFFELAAGLLAMAIENARAHEALDNLSRERSRFMLRVAHNLRAPLAATASMVEVVRKLHLGDLNESQAEYLRRIDRRIRTMAAMIDELLALSRARAEEAIDVAEPVDLATLAGRLQRTFEPLVERKGLRLDVNVPEGLPWVCGSATLLEQVFENLISNAVKYTLEGGVEVACAVAGREVRVEIRDTGIGIPAADVPQLFSDFYRARNARAVEEIGTGLGLVLVREMLQRMGGRITVASEEGRGSVFTVLLPIAEEDH